MRLNPSIDNDRGIYRAIVADNQDKLQLGRVKIRVPCYHGTHDNGIPDKDLPWASICMVGASAQSGMFIVPEVNSTVWVMFENGNHSTPVVLGGVYSRGTASVRVLEQSPTAYAQESDDRAGRMVPALQHDIMEGIREDTSVKVVYRSPKGAQIIIRDKDGAESIEIADANGQAIKLESPMNPVYTKDNNHRFTNPSDNLASKARMSFTNNLGQIFSISSDGKSAGISLVDKLSDMGIEIDGETKKCRVFNHQGFKVELSVEDERIRMNSSDAMVEINNQGILIKGAKVILESPEVTINGKVNVNGPLISGGVDLAKHYHSSPHYAGPTGGPVGSEKIKAPVYNAPNIEIPQWKEEV